MPEKIGIVTFHNAFNFGAALQAYALQQFLDSCGIENEIVDYQCDYIEKHYKKLIKIVKGSELKSFVGSLLSYRNNKKGIELSDSFRKRFLRTGRAVTREETAALSGEYSSFIAGSDQVWSPTCVGFDKTYFLDFARPEQKHSYAASFGCRSLPEDMTDEYRRLLGDFPVCSVREESGAQICASLGKDTRVDVDPTMLLDASDWDRVASEPVIRAPYIFVFDILKPATMISYAAELGQQKGIPVYHLNRKHLPVKGIRYVQPVSADGFVSLIKNAEYVITNSFHGCALSLIYHKQVVVELKNDKGSNSRIAELLGRLGMEARELDNGTVDPDSPIDWQRVDSYFDEGRESARQYLMTLKD